MNGTLNHPSVSGRNWSGLDLVLIFEQIAMAREIVSDQPNMGYVLNSKAENRGDNIISQKTEYPLPGVTGYLVEK